MLHKKKKKQLTYISNNYNNNNKNNSRAVYKFDLFFLLQFAFLNVEFFFLLFLDVLMYQRF